MSYFYVQKEGVYSHGVFWIGEDKKAGQIAADRLAGSDSDDYHEWVLYEHKENENPEIVYRISKPTQPVFIGSIRDVLEKRIYGY